MKNNSRNIVKLRYVFVVLIFLIISSLIFDIFILETVNMGLLKQQRREYLINLPKDETIKIGVVWSFSLGKEDFFKKGVELALEELNKKNVLGRKIEIIYRDDQSKKDVAKDIANDFATNREIVAVIAHDDMRLAVPASITYEYAGIVMISPAVSYPDFTRISFNYIFRNTPSDVSIAKELANTAKSMNFRKIVVLNAKDPYSETLAKVFIKGILSYGLEVVYDNKFKKGEKNFLEIITDISPLINRFVNYDAIFVVTSDEDTIPLLIKKARDRGIFAPFLTGNKLDLTNLPSKGGKELENTIVATIFNTELINEKTQTFIERFKKKYNVVPDTWGAQGYDAMMLLATAIKKAKSLDPELIASQLKYMKNFDSIFGKYSLNRKGDVVDRGIYVKRIKNKKFKYLYLK